MQIPAEIKCLDCGKWGAEQVEMCGMEPKYPRGVCESIKTCHIGSDRELGAVRDV